MKYYFTLCCILYFAVKTTAQVSMETQSADMDVLSAQAKLVNRGYELSAQNRFEEATEFFNKAIAVDDSFSEAYLARGWVSLISESYKSALNDFSHVIRKFPLERSAYFMRAQAYERVGNFSLALKDYEFLTTIDSSNYQAYFEKGRFLKRTQNWSEAVRAFDKCIKIDKNISSSYFLRALCKIELDKLDEAEKDFTEAIWYGRENSNLMLWRGKLRLLTGKTKEAYQDFKMAIEIDSINYLAYFGAGKALYQFDKSGPQSYFEKFIEHSPREKIQNSYYALAEFYCYAAEEDQALENLEQALNYGLDRQLWLLDSVWTKIKDDERLEKIKSKYSN